ncbi:class I SAM-dependent methyltransferase [Alteribacter natronophilus]|uniref:class I SAM-dependent methyltransferase n=1 Tax=Alteribacter natronophilus TaxID=2583810 RepID=UPI00110F5A1F|nr:class I SAM-dependent methyltransferase [Alteribacter natronophilus]TMW70097.1 class I SAM-dependent methyltransferase [Alteribacter natronophilus]
MIRTTEDVLHMLDSWLDEDSGIDWDAFYKDRERPVPFFADRPDENILDYMESGKIKPGRVLELGCGPGRNALHFARNGFQVDAVDSSAEALSWASERAEKESLPVRFIQESLYNFDPEPGAYDLVYDSGCFHHVPPHRREGYMSLVKKALKPGGRFALTCFRENGPLGGSPMTDREIYEKRTMAGGLGFTEEKLRLIFHEFTEIEVRPMFVSKDPGVFGVEGLLAGLFEKRTAARKEKG